MSVKAILQVWAVVCLSLLIAGCAGLEGGGFKPTNEQFSSQWIAITMGGMMAAPGEGMALTLSLKNKSKQPLYVVVAFIAPDPSQRCEVAKQLEASQSEFFSCPQKSLTPNVDYPVEIAIYTDEGRKNLLESPKTKFYFSENDAKAFEEISKMQETAESN